MVGARKALWNVSAFFLLDFAVEVQLLQCLRVYFQAIFIAFMLLDKIEFGLSHSYVACVSFSLHFFFFFALFSLHLYFADLHCYLFSYKLQFETTESCLSFDHSVN